MPVLTLEEVETETESREVGLPEEGGKPVICVFDPNALHRQILEYALSKLLEKVKIFWQSRFSRTFIGMAGISEDVYPGLIAMKKPILIVSELEVIPGGGYYGLEMLGNLRCCCSRLLKTPLMVISSKGWLEGIQRESMDNPEKLRTEWTITWGDLWVDWTFTWGDLESSPQEQRRLFNVVSQILGLESGPQKMPRA